MMKTQEVAIRYLKKHEFSVIPVNKDKKPLIAWEKYQKKKPTTLEIASWWKQWPEAMIGIVTGEVSNIVVIDIDRPEIGEKNLEKFLSDSITPPTVLTPRGGKHLYFRPIPGKKLANSVKLIPGCDFRGEGGYVVAPPSKNGNGREYRWLPNLSIEKVEIPVLPAAYVEHVEKETSRATYVPPEVPFTIGSRDNDLFHVANSLVKGGCNEQIAKRVLETLAQSCNPPLPSRDALAKLKSALRREGKKERNLAAEVKEWILSSNGVFLTSDIAKCLQLSSRDEQKNLSKILSRLCAEGLIEKYGNRNGQFRFVNREAEELDWLHADLKPLDVRWPFGLENFVSVYPGNIAVVAGSPNAGKTAFILNFIRLNQEYYDIHLFSSEGGKEELHNRITNFGYPLDSWRFHAWERTHDFADVIKPNTLNVIDYIEIYDKFYEIGSILRSISDRLGNGFCLVALQKPSGRDAGLGGERGLEKPRLYLAMDSGRLKIVKAKSWKNPESNPNGMMIEFKLTVGCKFINTTPWRKQST